jgi:hypothetical protein
LPPSGRVIDRGGELPIQPRSINEVIKRKQQIYVGLFVSRSGHLDSLRSGGNAQRLLVRKGKVFGLSRYSGRD